MAGAHDGMQPTALKLSDIQEVLGVSKAAASMIRAGKYDRQGSDLPQRYAALVRVVQRARQEAALDAAAICMACPREDCTGCRVAELICG
ncbi:MAG: hypothetical protein N2690_05755 [Rhodocyclaceae bacterium]|nr:hypothetical protein [Rhodocyclaceae bacterium]